MRNRKTKKKRFNIYILGLKLFVLFIVCSSAYSVINQGIVIREYKREIKSLNEQIKKENENIKNVKADIENYKTDEYIEKIARERLKMVKPGEIIYIDINKSEGY
ncbi:FtsB family cell division protein [Tepidibacter aestuarii]|uniref:FtsB family cell division protein n=1 Tax=Tepidibacter aestuarii TaxID=2925782 RepID=UPI0020BEF437|nr:septum formation initiator family protein [Tepidibacter aestuarii]CAH2215116.1 cell division protein DivIC [Tepidibacter aestuarii]